MYVVLHVVTNLKELLLIVPTAVCDVFLVNGTNIVKYTYTPRELCNNTTVVYNISNATVLYKVSLGGITYDHEYDKEAKHIITYVSIFVVYVQAMSLFNRSWNAIHTRTKTFHVCFWPVCCSC